ncbi:MAG: heavy metal translocating P-type ATPase, partial [Actinobacteria bacterium]|nr:heavy metal translocating P-type ATPase [Actinomycetota bacterium]MDA2946452.1 heavy metal translocating P-type ATPase [Actinomycetota bacterium]
LAVTGMTCAACAARIEKKLNRLDGVSATVNYATSKATVHVDESMIDRISVDTLTHTIDDMGYGAVAVTSTDDERSTSEIATDAHVADIRRRLIVAAIGALPVMVLSMISGLQFDGWQWLCLALAAPVVTWSAMPFHRAAWRNARHRTTTMDTLVSLGVIAASLWSVWALLFGGAGSIGMTMDMSLFPRQSVSHGLDHSSMVAEHHDIYLEVATTLTAFILAGRFFELRSRQKAGSALRALATMGARSAMLWRDGTETEIPIGALGVGEVFVVRPGEKVATDGVVIEGRSAVDRSLVTGESVPVDVNVGDDVTGGTVNTNGRLLVRATRIGRDTVLSQMARLVERAQEGKAPVQRLADRVSSVFVPIVIALAIGTLVVWLAVTQETDRSFAAAVSVLVIACPCALGLATPVALLVGTGRAARSGIIIRGAQVLEATRAVDVIVLDKTGTLTTGEMTLDDVDTSMGATESDVAMFAALEANSEHPIARAIVDGLRQRGVDIDVTWVTDFENRPGVGVFGVADGRLVSVRRGASSDADDGATIVEGQIDGRVVVRFVIRDRPRPQAATTIARLRDLGVTPMIASGDSWSAVRHVAEEVGVDPHEVRADFLPPDTIYPKPPVEPSHRVVRCVRRSGQRPPTTGHQCAEPSETWVPSNTCLFPSGSERARSLASRSPRAP